MHYNYIDDDPSKEDYAFPLYSCISQNDFYRYCNSVIASRKNRLKDDNGSPMRYYDLDESSECETSIIELLETLFEDEEGIIDQALSSDNYIYASSSEDLTNRLETLYAYLTGD